MKTIISKLSICSILFLLSSLQTRAGALFYQYQTDSIIDTANEVSAYDNNRLNAFSVTPEQLNMNLKDSANNIYGCIIEWSNGKNVVTVVAYKNGEVNMFLKSGKIYINGSFYEKIKKTGLNMIKDASLLKSETKLTKTFPLPELDKVVFYILTSKGKYAYTEDIEKLKKFNSKWDKTFEHMNRIIYDFRQILGK